MKLKYFCMLVLCLILLMTFIVGLCTACTDREAAGNIASAEEEQVTGFAWELINRDIENLESNPQSE